MSRAGRPLGKSREGVRMRWIAAGIAVWLCVFGSAQAAVPAAYGYGRALPSAQPVMDLRPWLAARPEAGSGLALALAPKERAPAANARQETPAGPMPSSVLAALEPSQPARFTVQIGAFSVRENAERFLAQFSQLASGRVVETGSGTRRLHRVRMGEFSSRQAAEQARERLLAAGIGEAIIAPLF